MARGARFRAQLRSVSDGIERRLSDREPLNVVSDPTLIAASLIGQREQDA